jgi:cellulose synthase/poly-beta-1,6-N-acetylglucosamine synthase-like glycosyltransferase
MILIWILIPLFILYSILIIYYWRSWSSIPVYQPGSANGSTIVSVIIPARNEEKNIGSLIDALQLQTYPQNLIDVIVIDDHSEDSTASIVKQYSQVKLLSLQEKNINSYKKKAIESGIAEAKGSLIVTTDADCVPVPTWLESIVSFQEDTGAVFIAAPVIIDCNSSILQVFQSLDFMVLQGITAAVVDKGEMSMCNGANIGYTREAFQAVEGFKNVDHIASGDDMLLMYKVWKKYPRGVKYIKSPQAFVYTQPMLTWKDFFRQRVRWASKAREYEDKRIFPVLLLVYLVNFSFLVVFVASFLDYRYWIVFCLLWLLKTIIEMPFFISVCRFFNKQWAIKWFLLFQPLHILYTIISGLLGQFGKYEWKGRRVK